MDRPDPIEKLPPLRDVIKENELAAKKSLGQNFLLDLNLTRKIARQAGELEGVHVIEIGPGPGGLTRALLLEGANKVTAIERDKRCVAALAPLVEASRTRLNLIEADALDFVPDTQSDKIKIVANLPYNIGTELLVRWLTPSQWPPFWDSMTLMFQKEVAQRIVATPGSKAYGRLSVLAQWRSDAKIAMTLPAAAFSPPPKIDSAVVHLTALPAARFEANPQHLERVVAHAFGQRRKMLRASLKGVFRDPTAILTECDIDPTRRAETLSLQEFCKLANMIP